MLLWKFTCYVSPSGRNEVQKTVDRYDDASSMAFQRAVSHLAVSPIVEWHEPAAKKLRLGVTSLYEVRYKANRAATRAIGFFGPQRHQFTITIICTHKQDVYNPPGALETAQYRAQQVCDGQANTVALQIDGEDFPADD